MGRECIEQLRAPFFQMFENVSEKMGGRGGNDLTVSFVRVLCVFDLEREHNLNSLFYTYTRCVN